MNKFCTKCGAKLDETTGLCPNCGAAPQPTPAKPISQPAPQPPIQPQPKKKPIFLIVLLCILLAVILIAAGVALLLHFKPAASVTTESSIQTDSILISEDSEITESNESSEASTSLIEAESSIPEPEVFGQFTASDLPDNAVLFDAHYYAVLDASSFSSYEEAAQYCADQNGYLATITSQEENSFLYSLLASSGYTEAFFGMINDGSWAWENGEAVTYANWTADVPEIPNTYGSFFLCMTPASDFITSINASSTLSEVYADHSASLICDNDLTTGWVEGVSGTGSGESITLTFDNTYTITGFSINAGYQKSAELYAKNARPASLQITSADGTSFSVPLQDVCDMQNISFDQPLRTNSLTFTLQDTYSGTTYEDTVISELLLQAFESNPQWLPVAFNNESAIICEWGEYVPAP